MNYSIRFKLFSFFSGLILFFILLSWILNSMFLDTYYYYNKKNSLMESYRSINSIYSGDPEEISLELEKLEQNRGMFVIIHDKEFNVRYITHGRGRDFLPRVQNPNERGRNQNLPESLIKSKKEQILSGKPIIENKKDSRLNSNFINLFAVLKNGDFLFLSTPVAAIEESADIANKFFVITGIVTIILGCSIVFFISGKFTRPILELSEIAQSMSRLDFNKRYPVKSEDEIGQLGKSINSLSEQLQKSILELQEANQKLKEDIEREREIDEMRKDFISSVSHELKTPIALIQGYAEGLKLNVNEDEENKNFYCGVIMDEAFKMNRLVKQLLELSHIQSGAVQLEKVDFNISQLVEQVLKKNELIFKNKEIRIVVEKEQDFLVDADYDKTEQVLMNYLNNAINHVDHKKLIRVGINEKENKVRVTVFNSGQHIPEECMEKIWKSFYKVDKARTREYGGTGLGLSIVRAVQEAHGNSYGADNVEGGVEFWFELDKK